MEVIPRGMEGLKGVGWKIGRRVEEEEVEEPETREVRGVEEGRR